MSLQACDTALESLTPPETSLRALDVWQHFASSATDSSHEPNQDEILRMADFLFGNMTEAALSIVDGGNIEQVVSVASARSFYLVKGSGTGKGNHQTTPYYVCMTPQHNGIRYCSCRSFLEKSRTSSSSSTAICCKHLLALELMPLLGMACPKVETASDKELSRLMVERISIDKS